MFGLPKWQSVLAGLGALVLVAVIAFGSGYVTAAIHYDHEAELTKLRSEKKTLSEDLRISRNAESSAKIAAAALDQKATETRTTINDLVLEIEARTGRDGCRLSELDARRLSDIR